VSIISELINYVRVLECMYCEGENACILFGSMHYTVLFLSHVYLGKICAYRTINLFMVIIDISSSVGGAAVKIQTNR
jgi:hypothetical protein